MITFVIIVFLVGVIGAAAVSVISVRMQERDGLVRPPGRRSNGCRHHDREAVE